jgi:hypothetical protein
LFDGFAAAVQNNRTTGGYPFGYFAWGKDDEFGDGDGEEIEVGGKDGGLVFEQVMQIAFELLDTAGSFLMLLGAVAFGVSNSPECVAFHEERTKEFTEPGFGLKLDGRECPVHIVLLDVAPARSKAAAQ